MQLNLLHSVCSVYNLLHNIYLLEFSEAVMQASLYCSRVTFGFVHCQVEHCPLLSALPLRVIHVMCILDMIEFA